MLNRLSPLYRKLLSLVVAAASMTAVFLFVLDPAMVEGSSQVQHGSSGEEFSVNAAEADDLVTTKEVTEITEEGSRLEQELIQPGSGHDRDAEGAGLSDLGDVQSGLEDPGHLNVDQAAGSETKVSDQHLPQAPKRAYGLKIMLLEQGSEEPLESLNSCVEAFFSKEPAQSIPAKYMDSDGRYELSGLKEGEYSLHVEVEGYAPFDTCVQLLSNKEVTCRLSPLGSVRIRITDQYARRLQPVEIRLVDDGAAGEASLLSSRQEDGFHVVEGLCEGVRKLQIVANGLEPHLLEVCVDSGEKRSYWAVLE